MLLLILSLFCCLFSPQPSFAQTDSQQPEIHSIKFSELMPQPDSEDDWFEIVNNGTTEVVLENYFVRDNSASNKNPLSGIIAPGQYLVFYWSNKMDNGGDSLKLYYQSEDVGNLIDEISYSSSTRGISWSHSPEGTFCETQPSLNLVNNSCIPPTPTAIPTILPSPTNQPDPTNEPEPTATPVPVYNPEVAITSVPSNLKQSQLFTSAFLAKNLKPNTNYYVKVYGGKDDNFGIETKSGSSYLIYTSAWDKFPIYLSDGSGQINKAVIGRIKPDGELGEYIIRMKIKEVATSSTAESPPRAIKVTEIKNLSPTPSLEPTPTLEEEVVFDSTAAALEELDQDTPTIDVLGISESPPDTDTKPKTFNADIIPLFFLVGGGLMLATPLVVNKFSKKNGKQKPADEPQSIEE